jgi:hypothetical protein
MGSSRSTISKAQRSLCVAQPRVKHFYGPGSFAEASTDAAGRLILSFWPVSADLPPRFHDSPLKESLDEELDTVKAIESTMALVLYQPGSNASNASLAKTHPMRLDRIASNRLDRLFHVSVSSRIRSLPFIKPLVRIARKISSANLNTLLCIERVVPRSAQGLLTNYPYSESPGFSLENNCLVPTQGEVIVQGQSSE